MVVSFQSRESLPSELKDAIAAFCSEGDLFILSLTDREFQAYAESRLYREVYVDTSDGLGIVALETIAGNPSKAKYVKLLGIDFDDLNKRRDEENAVMGNILRALPTMSNVEKLRIRLGRDRGDLWDFRRNALSDALW